MIISMVPSSSHENEPDLQAGAENVTPPAGHTADSSTENPAVTLSGAADGHSAAEPGVRDHLIIGASCLLTVWIIHVLLTQSFSSNGKFFDLIPVWYVTGIGALFTLLAFLGHMIRKLLGRFRKR
jgi:hypothetical protein